MATTSPLLLWWRLVRPPSRKRPRSRCVIVFEEKTSYFGRAKRGEWGVAMPADFRSWTVDPPGTGACCLLSVRSTASPGIASDGSSWPGAEAMHHGCASRPVFSRTEAPTSPGCSQRTLRALNQEECRWTRSRTAFNCTVAPPLGIWPGPGVAARITDVSEVAVKLRSVLGRPRSRATGAAFMFKLCQ